MFRPAILAALALVCVASNVEARPRHVATVCDNIDIMRPCEPSYALVARRDAVAPVAAHAIGGRPAGCPAHAWCGCWLAAYRGIADRSLWVARKWATLGQNAGGPRVGAIAVWPHHVGLVTAVDGNRIMLLSGNDGNAVRERWRPTSGVIAYRFAS